MYYSTERFVPTETNMIVLRCFDDYLYVHRDVYDKAVVLQDRYPEFDALFDAIGVDRNREIAESLFSMLPAPVKYLAPYLALLEDIEDEGLELEDLVGCLNVITMNVDVRGMLKVPEEVRRSVKFSLSAKEENSLMANRFLQTVIPYEEFLKPAPSYGGYSQPEYAEEEDEEEGGFVDMTDEEEEEFLNMFRLDKHDDEEEEKVEEVTTEEPEPEENSIRAKFSLRG